VAFSVLNTQLMSVMERSHEFGVVMAMGLRPGRLGRLVLLETFLLGMLGMALGIVLGLAVTAWFAHTGLSMAGMEDMAAEFNLPSRLYPLISVWSTLGAPLVVLAFTLLACLYPVFKLRRLEPVAAMRVEA
jgi:putative ABC transport system permease protein